MRHKLPIALLCAGILSALLCLSGCGAKPAVQNVPNPTKAAPAAPVQTEPAQTQSTLETTPIEEITHLDIQVEASGLWDLLDYPNLKSVDLSGSTCYSAILDFIGKNPQLQITYAVDVGGTWISSLESAATLENGSFDFDTLLKNLEFLPYLTNLTLPETELNSQQVEAIREACPELTVRCSVNILGALYDADTTKMDLSALDSSQVEQLLPKLGILENLTYVELMTESGSSKLSLADVAALQNSAPNTTFHYTFPLFGKTLSTTDEEVAYKKHTIGNEGEAQLREALAVMDNCKRFLLEDCGIDNEVLAQLREDFRDQTKVVWRIRFGKYSALTDAETIRAVYNVFDSTCHDLRYCEDVKYMDIGHNDTLTDLSFIGYMPNIEVLIASGCAATEIPENFSNCKKLTWLELANCYKLKDIAALEGCESLRFLNLSYSKVTDYMALDGLPLERFCCLSAKASTDEQNTFLAIHPDCLTRFYGSQPYGYGWRYDDNGVTFNEYYKNVVRKAFNYDYLEQFLPD
ncbi:MAG: leucine-rich repeat domain-containing protein [Oscillospiraceae bacterium]|nr:leucine-rich repeat domain-containing protein [Oscillospiraceae bacterium]